MTPPLLYAIVGPTATGKTQLALQWAQRHNAHIVVCDAFQVRWGLPLLTAKPTLAEQTLVPHHLLGTFPLAQPLSAAAYAQAAEFVIQRLQSQGTPVVLCGGTGLYLRALTQGLLQGPGADPRLRQQLRDRATHEGWAVLHQELQQVDPEAAARIHPNDPVRIERALEVFHLTGKPISLWQQESRTRPPRFRLACIGLDPGPARLRARIAERTQAMLDAGVVDEVAHVHHTLGTLPSAPLGYHTILSFLQGHSDASTLQQQLSTETMQYAKRQRTWFRALPNVRWFATPEEACTALCNEPPVPQEGLCLWPSGSPGTMHFSVDTRLESQ